LRPNEAFISSISDEQHPLGHPDDRKMTDGISKNLESISNQRYERKFYLPALPRSTFEVILKHHPMRFCEVYPQRYVNNIYLDTIDMGNFSDNVVGVSKRLKVRLRWYGALMGVAEKPKLELKIKNNLLGTKMSFQLRGFGVDRELSKSKINNIFDGSGIPQQMFLYLKSLDLVLMNRYTRKYYQSYDGRYRITVDSMMDYYRLSQLSNTFSHKASNKNVTIVELKYDKDNDEQVNIVTSHLPFRVSKISKYVEGVKRLGIC
jgi:hypothetical protein